MSQCVLELSSFSGNTSLLSLAPLPDSSVNMCADQDAPIRTRCADTALQRPSHLSYIPCTAWFPI